MSKARRRRHRHSLDKKKVARIVAMDADVSSVRARSRISHLFASSSSSSSSSRFNSSEALYVVQLHSTFSSALHGKTSTSTRGRIVASMESHLGSFHRATLRWDYFALINDPAGRRSKRAETGDDDDGDAHHHGDANDEGGGATVVAGSR